MSIMAAAPQNPSHPAVKAPAPGGTVDFNWSAISAICAAIMAAGALYSYISSLKDKALNNRLDAHFEHQTDCLERIDRTIESTGKILQSHGERISAAESRLDTLDYGGGRSYTQV